MKKLYREMNSFEKLHRENFNLPPRFEVIEDNAGGLYLFVFDSDNKCVYAHSGYEFNKGQIRDDIICLESVKLGGELNISDWGGCEESPQEYYDEIIKDETVNGFNIVMDNHETYFHIMGLSAESEFLS